MPPEIQAGAVNLLQLLRGEKEFVSPLFQRRYVWTDTEISNFWQDVDGVLEGTTGTRFLGAVVLEVKAAGLAFQPDSMWIVDGQQRLTTLYLILLRIAVEAEKAGISDLAATLYKQYLFNQDGDHKDQAKLKPTLLDYKQFSDTLEDVKQFIPKLATPFGDQKGVLQRAARSISRSVTSRCKDENGKFAEDKARKLVVVLLEQLKFVQIVLGEAQDSHQVFDRLNTGGIRLENKDLIRNIVFEKLASNPNDADALYHSKWLPFEERLGARLDDYFFPFALIHKSTVTKATVLSSLRLRWKDKQPIEIVADLNSYVDVFDALTLSAQEVLKITESKDLIEMMARLQKMRVPSSAYPFLMRLLQAYICQEVSEAWTIRNIQLIEAFLVRRSIAGYEPTGLHAVFKGLFAETNGEPAKFVAYIDATPTVQFPDDKQFERDIAERPLYTRKLASYILYEYERGLQGGDSVPEVDITIDHVMPQTLTSAWEGFFDKETHARLKDTWANLVPLSMAANSEKGQKPWADVRAYFQTETVFKTTKRLAQTTEVWDKDAISKRAEQLALWAVTHWSKTV